jgi:hypothetical protein
MENEHKNSNQEQNNDAKPSLEKSQSVFTKGEIRDTVKGFILAWLRGDVSIHFPRADEIQSISKKGKEHLEYKDAFEREMQGKLSFIDFISIIAERKPATVQEQEVAMSNLFDRILAYRCGDRIEGKFEKHIDIDERLSKLEEQFDVMNDLLQELVIWYRSQMKR